MTASTSSQKSARRRPKRQRRTSGQNSGIRCFAAIGFPPGILESFQRVLDWGGDAAREIRWVKPAQLHLTLAFLGDVPQSRIPRLIEELERKIPRHAVFTLQLGSAGQFPERGKPRVLWWGIGGQTDALESLAEAVRACAGRLQCLPDKKPFSAHVTLGRVREGKGPWIHWPPPDPVVPGSSSFRVDRVRLYRSDLGSGGPRYSILHEFPLR